MNTEMTQLTNDMRQALKNLGEDVKTDAGQLLLHMRVLEAQNILEELIEEIENT